MRWLEKDTHRRGVSMIITGIRSINYIFHNNGSSPSISCIPILETPLNSGLPISRLRRRLYFLKLRIASWGKSYSHFSIRRSRQEHSQFECFELLDESRDMS